MIDRHDALAAAADYGEPELADAVLRRLEQRLRRHAEATKLCRACGEVRPISEFSTDVRNSDGLRGRCRPCRAADARGYRRRLREASHAG